MYRAQREALEIAVSGGRLGVERDLIGRNSFVLLCFRRTIAVRSGRPQQDPVVVLAAALAEAEASAAADRPASRGQRTRRTHPTSHSAAEFHTTSQRLIPPPYPLVLVLD